MHGGTFPPVPTDGEDAAAEALLTVEETSERLAKVTPRYLRDLVKAGEIERVKIGRRVGYVESSVSAYIQRLREKAQVAA
jgi:excisionase family DNA binding protein